MNSLSIVAGMSLYIKLDGIFVSELGQRTMISRDLNGTSESEGNLIGDFFPAIHMLGSKSG